MYQVKIDKSLVTDFGSTLVIAGLLDLEHASRGLASFTPHTPDLGANRPPNVCPHE